MMTMPEDAVTGDTGKSPFSHSVAYRKNPTEKENQKGHLPVSPVTPADHDDPEAVRGAWELEHDGRYQYMDELTGEVV